MLDLKDLDEIARRLSAAIPPGATALGRELQDHFRAILASALERLDVVSRTEFDIQRCVLLRTREKLELLEQRIAALEAALAERSQGDPR
jgi:BMFP domain-containing protein YqiC